MSGKEKAENFDDDFELDALDEASWSDDESASEGDAEQALGGAGSKGKAAKASSGDKKSGGGLLSGLIVLALLGGGSFYAYQSGLIPGVSPGTPAAGESIMPALTDADVSGESAVDTAAETTQTAEVTQDMPPMPDSAVSSEAPIPEGAIEVTEGADTSLTPAPVADSGDDALTPMPEVTGDSASELSPLETTDAQIDLAQIAEKDGMALAADAASGSEAVAAVDGKLEDGVMAIPGVSGDDALPLVGSADADSVASSDLDEAALLGETEKAPSTAPEPAESTTPAAAEGADPLSEISNELAASDTSTQTEVAVAAEAPVADSVKEDATSEDAPASATAASPAPAEAVAAVPADLVKAPEVAPVAEPMTPAADAAPSVEAKTASEPAAKAGSVPADVKPAETNAAETAAPTKPADSPTKAEAPKPVKPVVTPNWVLKSAKPGLAVLYDKRTGDVKTIGVGDRVSGLGTIKSVAKVDGKWVVQGTSGKVRQ